MGDVLYSGDLHVGGSQSPHFCKPYRGKQQYTQNSLITCFWNICATVQFCQIQITSGCYDLENDVKVKLFIWNKVTGKDNHLALLKSNISHFE